MKSKKTITIFVLLLLFVFVPVLLISRHGATTLNKKHTSTSTGAKNDVPDSSVISVVQQYVSAREDAIGADQTTPTSWISGVQLVTTPSWFAQLQPDQNSSTGTTPASYYLAHNKNYIIQVKISGCIWSLEGGNRTANEGDVYCNLLDKTVDRSTGRQVKDADLPFGWTQTGKQIPVLLKLVRQNGAWLVDGDSSGQG